MNLFRHRWDCFSRGLCPPAWAVKWSNWQASQFFRRSPSNARPSSTMSKQWQVGQTYVHAPHPTHFPAWAAQSASL